MARTVILAGTLMVVGIVLTGLSAVQLGVARAAAKWPSAQAPRVGRRPALAGIVLGAIVIGGGGGLVATMTPAEGTLWVAAVAGAGVLLGATTVVLAARLAAQVELKALISTPSPAYVAIAPRGESPPAIAARSQPVVESRSQTATGTVPGATPPVPAGDEPVSSVHNVAHNTSPEDLPIPYMATDSPQLPIWDRPDVTVPPDAEPGWVYQDADDTFLLVVDIPAGTGQEGRRLVRLEDFTLVAQGSVREPLRLAGSIEISVWPLA